MAGFFSRGGEGDDGLSAPSSLQQPYFAPTVIFRMGAIKIPLLPPWAGYLFHSLTSIVDLEELALVLDSSHDSFIFFRDLKEDI